MDDAPPRRICLVQLNRIGDLILVTPILRALHERFPDAELHLLTGKHNAAVGERHPLVHRTHVYTKHPWDTVRLLARLRGLRFDVWIDPKGHSSTESGLFARLAGAPMRIGHGPDGAGAFTHPAPGETEHPGLHVATRALMALRPLGIKGGDVRPALYTDPDSDARLAFFLRTHGISDYVLVNISATGADRRWPVRRWIELLKRLDAGPYVISATQDDRAEAGAIASGLEGKAVTYESRSIVDVFSVVARSRRVLTVDTAVVHIASAFNRPTVALYVNRPWFFAGFLPLADHHRIVMHPEPEALVSRIPVDVVEEAFRALDAEAP